MYLCENFLVFESMLSMKRLMKNEFMNDIQMKADFELAKRLYFDYGGSMLTHISGPNFEFRTYTKFEKSDLETLTDNINKQTKKLKFKVNQPEKKSNLKEFNWNITAQIK